MINSQQKIVTTTMQNFSKSTSTRSGKKFEDVCYCTLDIKLGAYKLYGHLVVPHVPLIAVSPTGVATRGPNVLNRDVKENHSNSPGNELQVHCVTKEKGQELTHMDVKKFGRLQKGTRAKICRTQKCCQEERRLSKKWFPGQNSQNEKCILRAIIFNTER